MGDPCGDLGNLSLLDTVKGSRHTSARQRVSASTSRMAHATPSPTIGSKGLLYDFTGAPPSVRDIALDGFRSQQMIGLRAVSRRSRDVPGLYEFSVQETHKVQVYGPRHSDDGQESSDRSSSDESLGKVGCDCSTYARTEFSCPHIFVSSREILLMKGC